MKLNKAQRKQVKLRLGLSGPSGYGKSYSSLLLAFGITNDWSKIAIIDTENNSANLYAHLGDFNVLQLNDPYSPERYIEAIKICENANIEVIIIDSITHEWQGKGGCLQIHEQLGGRFQDWNKVSPRHQAFIDSILQSTAHIITTTRRKVDYSLDTISNGRTRVVKHGTKEITREGFEYELTANFELINDKHLVRASKDRTGLFMDKPEFIISKATGKKLIQWCNEGVSFQKASEEVERCETTEGLKHLYNKYSSLQKQLYPLIVERKKELENISNQIISKANVEPKTKIQNGINKK
ncbi:AAA family ATPase [Mesonia mobilis]|uniref:Signal recognition particle subunit FFH/SRP54 (Srp54) n=1 Tax=Mesonia mobilis TaxID=369791 RepID=A0ABQ3BST2_9FLAO|nr:AAA family ATPase [Mesonia mobilis]MBQ0739107.1 AAA family ATPase [Aquimarina celericrescens]GGZ56434.1 hypothetical protein GCM10008088_17510 [Mesonia mobilis]